MNFIERQKQVQEAIGTDHVLLLRPLKDGNNTAPAEKYMKKDTKEYYYLALEQITITRENIEDHLDLLNSAGLELYYSTLKRTDFRNTFQSYDLHPCNSGFWSSNASSAFFSSDECVATLNSYNNWQILGTLTNGQNIVTSPIIFHTDTFCLTKSGSLYQLSSQV